jgi:hypothetical protein
LFCSYFSAIVLAVHIKRNASQEVVLWSIELIVLLVLLFSVANIQINTERHEFLSRNKLKNTGKKKRRKEFFAPSLHLWWW